MTKQTLYRDPANGRIAGVCAGIAARFDMETWLVRIIAFSIAITNFGLFFIIYIAAWLLMDKKPEVAAEHETVTVKSKVWQRGESPTQAIREISQQFDRVEQKLQRMERVVTSREFELHKEFGKFRS